MNGLSVACRLASMVVICGTLIVSPASAQEEKPDNSLLDAPALPSTVDGVSDPGRVAESLAGRAGQRQNKDELQNIKPLARVENRFANRVQNRLRARIDRYRDLRANTASPFTVAADQIREADPRARR